MKKREGLLPNKEEEAKQRGTLHQGSKTPRKLQERSRASGSREERFGEEGDELEGMIRLGKWGFYRKANWRALRRKPNSSLNCPTSIVPQLKRYCTQERAEAQKKNGKAGNLLIARTTNQLCRPPEKILCTRTH